MHWREKKPVPIALRPAAKSVLRSLGIKLPEDGVFSIGPGTAAVLRARGVGILAGRYVLVSKEELEKINELKARKISKGF